MLYLCVSVFAIACRCQKWLALSLLLSVVLNRNYGNKKMQYHWWAPTSKITIIILFTAVHSDAIYSHDMYRQLRRLLGPVSLLFPMTKSSIVFPIAWTHARISSAQCAQHFVTADNTQRNDGCGKYKSVNNCPWFSERRNTSQRFNLNGVHTDRGQKWGRMAREIETCKCFSKCPLTPRKYPNQSERAERRKKQRRPHNAMSVTCQP